jgi:hypothetical protein
MQIAEEGLGRFNMGSSAAMSTIMTLCLLLISLAMLASPRRGRQVSTPTKASGTAAPPPKRPASRVAAPGEHRPGRESGRRASGPCR